MRHLIIDQAKVVLFVALLENSNSGNLGVWFLMVSSSPPPLPTSPHLTPCLLLPALPPCPSQQQYNEASFRGPHLIGSHFSPTPPLSSSVTDSILSVDMSLAAGVQGALPPTLTPDTTRMDARLLLP